MGCSCSTREEPYQVVGSCRDMMVNWYSEKILLLTAGDHKLYLIPIFDGPKHWTLQWNLVPTDDFCLVIVEGKGKPLNFNKEDYRAYQWYGFGEITVKYVSINTSDAMLNF